MAEAAAKKTEYEAVTMTDGRVVQFAGKQRVKKETIIDESRVLVDGDTITLQTGAVSVRFDFRNGQTRTFSPPLSLIPRGFGHGLEQKYGDEMALPTPKPGEPPVTIDDLILAVEDLDSVLAKGDWRRVSEGGSSGGGAGASVVIRALVEATGKPVDAIKAFLQGQLDAAAVRGEKLTRNDLYRSFRNPESIVGKIIQRMEAEALAKESKFDADAGLEALKAA